MSLCVSVSLHFSLFLFVSLSLCPMSLCVSVSASVCVSVFLSLCVSLSLCPVSLVDSQSEGHSSCSSAPPHLPEDLIEDRTCPRSRPAAELLGHQQADLQ